MLSSMRYAAPGPGKSIPGSIVNVMPGLEQSRLSPANVGFFMAFQPMAMPGAVGEVLSIASGVDDISGCLVD